MSARELTPPGRGGVAVIEVCGQASLERLEGLLQRPLAELDPGVPHYARLVATGELLDEAIVLVHSPGRAELHTHGSVPLVRRLLTELAGAPESSEPSRALEVRARRALALAWDEEAARILLDQAEGALRSELERMTALEQAAFFRARAELCARSRAAHCALEPRRVVLAGPVNAGKSTLFNLLLGRRRAVVSDESGTTRDLLHERAHLGRWPIELIDTAGERELAPAGPSEPAAIERAGQELGRSARREADWTVWLQPLPAAGEDEPPVGAGRRTRLYSRADRVPAHERPAPWVSALREPERCIATLTELFREVFSLPAGPWVPGAAVVWELERLEELERADGENAARAWIAAQLDVS